MKLRPQKIDCMTNAEMDAIIEFAIAILDEVGMKIESPAMCKHLAEHGVTWDGGSRLHFPRKLIRNHLEVERRPANSPPRPAYVCGAASAGTRSATSTRTRTRSSATPRGRWPT